MKQLKLVILLTLFLNSFFGLSVNAEMPGMSGEIRRDYSDTQFGRVHHWTIGDGPALLLVHQSGQTSAEYLTLAPFLADTFKVIGIDLPNHGQSDTSKYELNVNEYADSVIDVLNVIGVEKVHILGQHGGAVVAINLGLRYPERTGKLILSGAGREENLTDEQIQELIDQPMTRDLPVDTDGEFLKKTWSVYRRMSATKTTPEMTFQPFLTSLINRQRKFDLHYAIYRYQPNLDNLNKETLLLEAEEDEYAGNVTGLQRRIKGSTIKKVSNSGSWQFYEEPELNAKIITEFLNQ
jgi:pimeloyl-ACP methyl ester carboxylesterase